MSQLDTKHNTETRVKQVKVQNTGEQKESKVTVSKQRIKMWGAVVACMVALGTPCLVSAGVVNSLYFVDTPSSQKVVRGSEAVLQCSASPSSSMVDCRWSKDGVLLSSSLPRHSMRGCSLVITPVLLEDEGEYRCQVAGRSTSPLLSSAATLEVEVEPGRPSIMEAREGDWVEVERGEEVLLTCESQGGRPHAEIQWRDAEGQIILGHAQEHITRIQHTNTFKTVSTLRFNPLQPMVVTCTAHSEAFPEVLRSNPLTVQLRRKVQEEQVMVRTGGSVTISIPENNGPYKWLLNGREVEGETSNSLDIEEFTPDYDMSLVKGVQEKFGGETRVLKLVRLVHDATPVKRKPRVEEVEVQGDQPSNLATSGRKSLMTCTGEEGREPKYVWVDGQLETSGPLARDQQGRRYRCTYVQGGVRKVKMMERKMKGMAKDLRRFSKLLGHFR